jgi:hypothetical protein
VDGRKGAERLKSRLEGQTALLRRLASPEKVPRADTQLTRSESLGFMFGMTECLHRHDQAPDALTRNRQPSTSPPLSQALPLRNKRSPQHIIGFVKVWYDTEVCFKEHAGREHGPVTGEAAMCDVGH